MRRLGVRGSMRAWRDNEAIRANQVRVTDERDGPGAGSGRTEDERYARAAKADAR